MMPLSRSADRRPGEPGQKGQSHMPPRESLRGPQMAERGNAERMCLEDVSGGANGKGMVVFVDLFGAVGDRAAAFYNIVRGRGVDANPMAFFCS